MGLMAKTRSSGVLVMNMFSPKLAMWPDLTQSSRSMISGVFTST